MRPFCTTVPLVTRKRKSDYPLALETVADHLKKKRLDLQLTKEQAGNRLGVQAWTYSRWESGTIEIPVRFYPRIIQFLGYHPLPKARTFGEAVRRERMTRGMKRLTLARHAGVVESTIERLENDAPGMLRRSKQRVARALGLKLNL